MTSAEKQKFKQTEIGAIPEEWRVAKIEELLECTKGSLKIGPFGSQLKKEFMVDNGFKVYGQENIFKNDFSLGDRYITEERFNLLRTCELEPDDIIISMMGTIGFAAIVPENIEKGIMDSHLLRLRINKTKCSKEFLLYALRSKLVQNQINSLSVGTIMAGLSSKIIKMLVFPSPSLSEQKAIGNFLSILDSRIELIQRMNKTLATIGEAVFRRWFVDFEFPDEEGKPYKSSGGKMVYNDELEKEIPKGWKITDISKVTDVIDCLHSKKPERVKEGKVLLQVFNIAQNGELNLSDFYYVSDVDYDFWTRKIELKKGDLIISKTGRVGAIAQIPEGFKFGIGRNLVAIRPTKITPTFTLEYLLSKYGKRETQRLTMSGTILRSLHVKYIKKLQILVPPLHVINLYEKIARPFRARIENNIKENIALSQLRDILLPKLMSGKIRVPITEDNMEVC